MSTTSDPMVPGTQTCGCCAGVAASTPMEVSNRIGLAAIGYRIGTYAQFKDSLHAGLSSPEFPQLAGLRTRDADDYTLGLLDAVACVADVLTFYQERIANESWLRTATERVSLQEMAKLIGYRLRPGLAAETWLAFAMEPPKAPPPRLGRDPGAFVTGIPVTLELDPGLKVQSVPGPGEAPQTFETIEAIQARPEWNAMPAVTREDAVPGVGSTDTWLQGIDTHLKAGDWLVFVDAAFDSDATSTAWDARVLLDVEPDSENDRTRVRWGKPLANVSSPTMHALRQRAAVFGHNAPDWNAMSVEFRLAYADSTNAADLPPEWPPVFDIHCSPTPVFTHVGGIMGAGGVISIPAFFDRSGLPVSLDAAYPKIVAQGLALLVTPNDCGLYRIAEVSETSRAQFAIAGKSTCIDLDGQDLARFSAMVRSLGVFAQSEKLQRGFAPKLSPVQGNVVEVAADASALPAQRRVLIQGIRIKDGTGLVHPAEVVSVASAPGGSALTIDPPLPAALHRQSVVVFANVARATHGETVTQVLGAGDAGKRFQRFELKHAPLTYRSADTEDGSDSALTVRVGGIEWDEKPTLYGSGATERAYAVRVDAQDKQWVVFGDGVQGARLPSGTNNVEARYRKGLGSQGNVAAEQLTQLVTRPLGLKSVSNPAPALGGVDREPADRARRTMPLGTRTLGRVVSLLDYEDFALARVGIAKAQAQVLALDGGPTIALTVAAQDGVPFTTTNPVWTELLSSLKHAGDPHVRVVLLSYRPSTFFLGLKIKRDPAYERKALLASVEAALRAHFAFAVRALGQPVLQSEVIAAVHAVPGVVAVDLDALYGGTAPASQTVPSRQTRLLASRMRVEGGVVLPAELLTLDPSPLGLEDMP